MHENHPMFDKQHIGSKHVDHAPVDFSYGNLTRRNLALACLGSINHM